MGAGIEQLRDRRGDEQVSFGDIADHLADYAERHPDDGPVIERLAGFLAGVEDVDHDHDRHPGHGLPPGAGPSEAIR